MARRRINTIFFKTSSELSRNISLESPESARKSLRYLDMQWKKSKTRAKKRRLKRSAVLSANRSNAQLQRKTLSSKERGEFTIIERMYRDWDRRHPLPKR